MNATTHPFASEEIMALLDGELPADRAQAVSAHVEQCAECQEVQATVQAVSQKMAAWKVDAPQRLREDIFLRDSQVVTSQQGGVVSLSWLNEVLIRKRIWVPALAFMVVLFVVVGALTSRPKRSMQEMTRSKNAGTLGRLVPFDNQKVATTGHAAAAGGDEDAGKALRPESSKEFEHLELYSRIERPVQQPESPQGLIQAVPMIARMVSLSIVVKDFDASRAALDALLMRNNGYAAGLNVATPQGAPRALQASLRIPAHRLGAALLELKALGRVEIETQNGEEVTQQHADLVARLKNSRETERRLQAILLQRTGKISDVLSVEQEIARVRGEIEQMEAEQQTLEHRVDFATIDLKLAEEYKAQLSSPAPSVASQVRNASVIGFRNAFESLLALILFFAEATPTLLLWLTFLSVPAWYFWRRYWRAFAMS
jgi:hypothetical protein